MSAEATTAVLHHSKAEGSAKLVLWGIANHHSDMGAWPSVATLAKYAAVTERRVQQLLRYLQSIGEIQIEAQAGFGNNQYKTNRYHILIQCPADCDGSLQHKTGVKSGVVRGEIQSQSGVKPASVELNKEPNNNHAQIEAQFDEFWNAYPRKLDKAKAFRAFKSALRRAKFEDILAGVLAYRNDPKRNPDYTKYPATWLNNDAWENAATLPETRIAIEERRERERKSTQQFLDEQEKMAKRAAPPPKCKHGKSIALCNICIRKKDA